MWVWGEDVKASCLLILHIYMTTRGTCWGHPPPGWYPTATNPKQLNNTHSMHAPSVLEMPVYCVFVFLYHINHDRPTLNTHMHLLYLSNIFTHRCFCLDQFPPLCTHRWCRCDAVSAADWQGYS